ncbi:MAG TPA: bifunctional pyr operon transcriptional regulator/uracil phosphoribosyltransferase PyrR [Sulfuricella sp.]|nr:bifunctional pyr operon transcriptional regulator/uracil phosphoribosyltransferase PyrR [Sulfuricella sp.]
MQLPEVEELLRELAQQIRPHLTPDTVLVGIHTGGVWVAENLREQLGVKTPLGALDISFYRDDFSRIGLHPEVKPSRIPFEVEGRHIILVDDVLKTGRSIRAAMNDLFDFGRPASILLAVLVDRGGRELPIAARFVGVHLDLEDNQDIRLNRAESGQLSLSLDDAKG